MLVKAGGLRQPAADHVRHAQQVEGFRDAGFVIEPLKYFQSLPMIVSGFARLKDIQAPISEPVVAARQQDGVAHLLSECKRLL